jgi:hypothetical protein
MALDPVVLAEQAGVTPDPWQTTVLRSTARQVLMLCPRQAGKSTTAGLLAVDDAIHRESLVLLLAAALRQSSELFRPVKAILRALGDYAPPIVQESALTLELANGARIVSLPGTESTIRGFSKVGLLVIDEGSRVRDDLYQSVRPMLSVSRGRLVALSTPFGKRGWFHHEATSGSADWERVTVTAHDVPRIAPEWLEAERNRIGDWWFRQEYMCEFVDTNDQVFSHDLVMAAMRDDIQPLFPAAA